MNVNKQAVAIADAKARFMAAGKQLKVLGLPLETLYELLEHL
jgi:hypothetical protein